VDRPSVVIIRDAGWMVVNPLSHDIVIGA